MDKVKEIFESVGGQFASTPESIRAKLHSIDTILFDWDGVFNSGYKSESSPSAFTEGDSMGTNMLRFSQYLSTGKMPKTFIVTGAKNPAAIEFVKREKFDGINFGFLNKLEAIDLLSEQFNVDVENSLFVYDDILDLGLASKCGLRFFVSKDSNPALNNYVKRNNLLDYASGHTGGKNAVREICEMIISLNGNYDEVVTHRSNFTEAYQEYFSLRKSISPRFFQNTSGEIEEIKL